MANYYAHNFERDDYVIEPGICLHLTTPSEWSGDETNVLVACNESLCLRNKFILTRRATMATF